MNQSHNRLNEPISKAALSHRSKHLINKSEVIFWHLFFVVPDIMSCVKTVEENFEPMYSDISEEALGEASSEEELTVVASIVPASSVYLSMEKEPTTSQNYDPEYPILNPQLPEHALSPGIGSSVVAPQDYDPECPIMDPKLPKHAPPQRSSTSAVPKGNYNELKKQLKVKEMIVSEPKVTAKEKVSPFRVVAEKENALSSSTTACLPVDDMEEYETYYKNKKQYNELKQQLKAKEMKLMKDYITKIDKEKQRRKKELEIAINYYQHLLDLEK